ncbi:MAG TPA: DUF5723 family protein [Candidatus Krumholzibacteria bacterium]|nr:DUF5723 family protein [Candidatus Krumholzibacteria bacterium]HPD71338.1 DUF5723 family protein [Candidatus Krumholzibacteria bacterium]HRY38962.1 DUF5723 family protein [Candidatus Krumholzibacteria bacterium]
MLNRHLDRHRRPLAWVGLAASLGFAATAAAAGDARSLAMGGAATAAARGLAAAAWNPANLAFGGGASLGLAGVTADLYNNSFSLGRYNEVAGETLTESDKARLLADIPVEGFALDGSVSAGALGLQIGRFALTTAALGAGRGNLDRDFFDLVLFGNEPGATVDVSDTWGEGWAVGEASLSWGQPLATGASGRLALGVTASYLQGLYEMHVEEARGAVTTSLTEIAGEAYASAVKAEGGTGWGLDLGLAWQAPGGWTLGVAADNVIGRVDWDRDVERTVLRVTAADLNALNDDLDEAIADSDTTYAAAGYTTELPARLRFGAAHDGGTLLIAADVWQGFADRAGASRTPQVNLGAEWRPFGLLTPRAGVSLGGSAATSLAGGLGLRLGFWQIDLAVCNRGGLSGADARGLGFGASTQLVF